MNYDHITNNLKKNYDFKPNNMNNIANNQGEKKIYIINNIKNIINIYPQNKNVENQKPKHHYLSAPKSLKKIKPPNVLQNQFKLKLENKFNNNLVNDYNNNKKEDIIFNKNKLNKLLQEKNSILSSNKTIYKNQNNKFNKIDIPTKIGFHNQNNLKLMDLEKLNLDYKNNSYDANDIKIKINSLAKEIKINKLKINLIFFYQDFSDENVSLHNKLKLEVLGGYFGVRKVSIFKKLLNEMENESSSFILISIGSSFKKIVDICESSDCIKYIIIFCMNVNKYEEKYGDNLKVKLISNDQKEIYDYLIEISEDEPDYNKNLKNLINHNLLISFYEYENYYYVHHKMLSFFLKKIFQNYIFVRIIRKKYLILLIITLLMIITRKKN